jgi:lysophospholipase L1-like esterase
MLRRKGIAVFVILVLSLLSGACGTKGGDTPAMPHITVFLAGDSTVATYPADRAPLAGWGQFIGASFTDRATIRNAAESGRSSKSFMDEGKMQPVWDEIKKGDYLLIQFGHNDEKTDEERHTDPYTTYKSYLRQYIDGARERGAFPVLVTPMNRRNFNANGTLAMTHGAYPAAMIQLGKEMNVPVIDLHQSSKKLFEQLGDEPTKKLFLWLAPGENANYPEGSKDNTHFNEYGASEMAKLVVQGVRETKLPLAAYLQSQ